jgi:ABC-2 type transport system permease protein
MPKAEGIKIVMYAFIKKEFFHIFRDYRSMLILFGMPVVQVLLFGFAITTDINDAKIAILDQSKDPVTRELTQKLLSSKYFILEQNLQSNHQIEAAFKAGNIKEVVVFEQGFAEKLQRDGKADVQLILDASEPNTASMLNAYSSGIINTYSMQQMRAAHKIPVSIQTESMMLYNPELKSVYMFVPGSSPFC